MLWRRGPEETRPGGGVLVDRHLLAAGLRDATARAGAQLLKASRVARPLHPAPRRWQVPVETDAGSQTIESLFLVDARGRAGRVAGRPQRRGAATLALTGSWRGAAIGGRATRIEAGEDCWYWGSPEPGGGFGASVFTSPERVAEGLRTSGSLAGLYRALLARSLLLRGCLAGELLSRCAPAMPPPPSTRRRSGRTTPMWARRRWRSIPCPRRAC